MLRASLILLTFCFTLVTYAQDNPFIKLVNPLKEKYAVTTSRQFIIGSTCKTCTVNINGNAVKVYSTGAIAQEVNLAEGDTSFLITAANSAGKTTAKMIGFSFAKLKPAEAVKSPGIESIQTFPEGNLVLMSGDKIRFTVKAFPGSDLKTYGGTSLYEVPVLPGKGMPGIYRGEYTVKASDNFSAIKFPVTATAPTAK